MVDSEGQRGLQKKRKAKGPVKLWCSTLMPAGWLASWAFEACEGTAMAGLDAMQQGPGGHMISLASP